jgi:hypothetical protein
MPKFGFHHSEESKHKMSLSRIGKPHKGKPLTEEHKAKIGEAHKRGCYTYGPKSEETKHKLSLAHMGKPSWNKGLTKETNPILAEISRKRLENPPDYKHTEEFKDKIREAHKRGCYEYSPRSEETKLKISLARQGQPSYIRTPEHKQQMSQLLKGRDLLSPEARERAIKTRTDKNPNKNIEKIHKPRIGRKLSQKTKDKIGIANKGRKHTEEFKKMVSLTFKGKPRSDAYKENLSKKLKGRVFTPTWKAKISQTMKERGTNVGQNNSNWHGGISVEPYTEEWEDTIREQIRQRDSHVCQLCHNRNISNNHKLSVHHIDYDKHNSIPQNLITLCKKCHTKTNYSRPYWQDYFTNLMINRFQENRII